MYTIHKNVRINREMLLSVAGTYTIQIRIKYSQTFLIINVTPESVIVMEIINLWWKITYAVIVVSGSNF